MTKLYPDKLQASLDAAAVARAAIVDANTRVYIEMVKQLHTEIAAIEALHPEPKRPRELWINAYGTDIYAYSTRQEALTNAMLGADTALFREVLPDEKPAVYMPEWEDLPKDPSGNWSIDFINCSESSYNLIRNKLMGLDQ